MNRQQNLQQLHTETFDVCIIGSGASGAGCALDATLRGMKVALIEKEDFAAATSSKSTKLIHGGVRYLEQAFMNFDFGQLRQVRHGLHERHILLQNAPHLSKPLAIITPVFSLFEAIYYSIGLRIYGWFAKNDPLPQARWLNKKETFECIPTLTPRLHSSVMYYDGQLDDARFCLALAQTASENGATVLNHASIAGFQKNAGGKIQSARVKDAFSGEEFEIRSKIFINCTGAFADIIRLQANPSLKPCIRPSKGVHLVLPADTLKSDHAMLIPKTNDGRVIFVIPFESDVMVGTTDDEHVDLMKEPVLADEDIDFLLDTVRPYLARTPHKSEVKAGFGGLRPLIAFSNSKATKKLIRDHEVEHDDTSNLVSLLGGKWTTYRLMAQDTIDYVADLLHNTNPCQTENKVLAGGENYDYNHWVTLKAKHNLPDEVCQHLQKKYGSRATKIIDIIDTNHELAKKIVPNYPFIEAEIVYQVRYEMAYTIRDVLARRIRLELFDWAATQVAIDAVAAILAKELGWTNAQQQEETRAYQSLVQSFIKTAKP